MDEPCWLCGDAHYCDECCRFVIHPESDSGYVEPITVPCDLLDPCCEVVDKAVFEHWQAQGYAMLDFRFTA